MRSTVFVPNGDPSHFQANGSPMMITARTTMVVSTSDRTGLERRSLMMVVSFLLVPGRRDHIVTFVEQDEGVISGSTKGRLLVAAPALDDGVFDRTVVYMLEHNTEGALGVVINRPSAET